MRSLLALCVALLASPLVVEDPRAVAARALEEGDAAAAARAFSEAAGLYPEELTLLLHLAHANLLAGNAVGAEAAARAAAPIAHLHVAQPLLLARALASLGELGRAYDTLDAALSHHQGDPRVLLEMASVASRAGLRGEARRVVRLLTQNGSLDASTALASFHSIYLDPDARPELEALVAMHPSDVALRARLAHAYAADGLPLAAARLFEAATWAGGDFAFEAAEELRRASRHDEALRANARVEEPIRRRDQAIAILFERGSYARVLYLAAGLDAPVMRYRRAYARYALGESSQAVDEARSLEDTRHRAAAEAILRALGRGGFGE